MWGYNYSVNNYLEHLTFNKNTGKTELVSGSSEMIQKGKSLLEELLEKLRKS